MWCRKHGEGMLLQIKVTPRAKQNRVVGVAGDFLKVAITAVPEKGRANDALVRFLARVFGVPPSAIGVTKGHNQPVKIIFLPITMEKLAGQLKQYRITV